MSWWIPAAIGLAAGGAKNILLDQPEYEKDLKLAALSQELSPYGITPRDIPKKPSLIGSGTQGALAGLSFGQEMGGEYAIPGTNSAKEGKILDYEMDKRGMNKPAKQAYIYGSPSESGKSVWNLMARDLYYS
jgi:hypothetical protein